MGTNLRKNALVFGTLYFFSVLWSSPAFAQECSQDTGFSFSPSRNSVNWNQFPEFNLPFTLIYSGSHHIYDPNALLKRGFTHVSNPNSVHFLPKESRAYIYYGVAGGNQPWATHKSPYGNDMQVYHAKWDSDLEWARTQAGGTLDYDIFCLDIEMHHKSRDSVLALKQMSFVPANLKTLSDDDFVIQYQKDMQELYAYAANYIKQKVNARIFTSYGDVPVFNTFTNIAGPSWSRWMSDPTLLNYISYDFNGQKAGGSYYNAMDALSPNAYFYYDYPHIFAGEYLSYLMFQMEVNKAWSDKDQLVFVWNRYSYTQQFVGRNIKPWMSEAMAIFPFFSGAKGLWLWDDMAAQSDYSGYEYFMKGLYRLSKFKSFFEGDYELIQSVSAREYNENRQPVWRGAYKDGKLLVAAHNPWATSENQEVKFMINYGNLKKEITLKGYEVFLCEYPADYVTGNEPETLSLKVYPNPAAEQVNYEVKMHRPDNFTLTLSDEAGRVLLKRFVSNSQYAFNGTLDLKSHNGKTVYLNVRNADFSQSKKIIVTK